MTTSPVSKHGGPGPHRTGTPQSVHGGDDAGRSIPWRPSMTRDEAEVWAKNSKIKFLGTFVGRRGSLDKIREEGFHDVREGGGKTSAGRVWGNGIYLGIAEIRTAADYGDDYHKRREEWGAKRQEVLRANDLLEQKFWIKEAKAKPKTSVQEFNDAMDALRAQQRKNLDDFLAENPEPQRAVILADPSIEMYAGMKAGAMTQNPEWEEWSVARYRWREDREEFLGQADADLAAGIYTPGQYENILVDYDLANPPPPEPTTPRFTEVHPQAVLVKMNVNNPLIIDASDYSSFWRIIGEQHPDVRRALYDNDEWRNEFRYYVGDEELEEWATDGGYLPLAGEHIAPSLELLGYDALIINERTFTSGTGGPQVVVFDPKNVTVITDESPRYMDEVFKHGKGTHNEKTHGRRGKRRKIESWDEVDKILDALTPLSLDAPRSPHPRSGFMVEDGVQRRLISPTDESHDRVGDFGPERDGLEFRVTEFKAGQDSGEYRYGQGKDLGTEKVTHVYRAMSVEEWEQAQARGFIQSDGRGVIVESEGTNAGIDPRTAYSYLPRNGSGVIVKIRVEDGDGWFTTRVDGYPRTRSPIPLDRIEAMTPVITKENGNPFVEEEETVDDLLDTAFPDGALTGVVPFPPGTRPTKGSPAFHVPTVTREYLRTTPPTDLQPIPTNLLRRTQGSVTRTGVRYYLSDTYRDTGRTYSDSDSASNRFPLLWPNPDGTFNILTGHHRAVAAHLRGEPLMARVVRPPSPEGWDDVLMTEMEYI